MTEAPNQLKNTFLWKALPEGSTSLPDFIRQRAKGEMQKSGKFVLQKTYFYTCECGRAFTLLPVPLILDELDGGSHTFGERLYLR